MIFNTIQFIPFIILVLVLHWALPWRYDKLFLLLVSWFFYASFSPPFILILWFTTILDWYIGKLLCRSEDPRKRKALLVLSCLSNLGLLGFFKYFNFMQETAGTLLSIVGIAYDPARIDILLPVGISFYTFQSLSYTIDVYRRKLKAYNFLDFALFVSLFTQLVAGPIVRATDLLPQLQRKKSLTFTRASLGIYLIVLGYFKKIVIADNLAALVSHIFRSPDAFSPNDILFGVSGFAVQIYCDFSGYSDIAIGLSLIMGFALKKNFNMPYLSSSVTEFWRRWHISLSSFIRDYIYIPMGGNRIGKIRQLLNLVIVMTLCGLWHGASWMFVLWGFYNGVLLAFERVVGWCTETWKFLRSSRVVALMVRAVLILVTFGLVNLGWILFRAANIHDALIFVRKLMDVRSVIVGFDRQEWVYIYVVLLVHLFVFIHREVLRLRQLHWAVYSAASALMLFMVFVSWETNNVFIYFQF